MEIEIGQRVRFTDIAENKRVKIAGRLGRYVGIGKKDGHKVHVFNVPGVGTVKVTCLKGVETGEAQVCRLERLLVTDLVVGEGDKIYCDACGEPIKLGQYYCYNEVVNSTVCPECLRDAMRLFKFDEASARLGAMHVLRCIRERMKAGGILDLGSLVSGLEGYFGVGKGAGEAFKERGVEF